MSPSPPPELPPAAPHLRLRPAPLRDHADPPGPDPGTRRRLRQQRDGQVLARPSRRCGDLEGRPRRGPRRLVSFGLRQDRWSPPAVTSSRTSGTAGWAIEDVEDLVDFSGDSEPRGLGRAWQQRSGASRPCSTGRWCSRPTTPAQFLPAFARVLPMPLFVHVRREPLDVALSILEARRRYYGDPSVWWSTHPPGYEALAELSPAEQIAGQVTGLRRAYAAQIAKAPTGAHGGDRVRRSVRGSGCRGGEDPRPLPGRARHRSRAAASAAGRVRPIASAESRAPSRRSRSLRRCTG